jgi:hypothetical protein
MWQNVIGACETIIDNPIWMNEIKKGYLIFII